MGLTERHWFEDEEPELTENQLEDILLENNKIFERGYQKGFSDGKSALLREQEPVPVYEDKISKCECGETVCRYWHPKFCGFCGRELLWY